jgi:hypothetical protein
MNKRQGLLLGGILLAAPIGAAFAADGDARPDVGVVEQVRHPAEAQFQDDVRRLAAASPVFYRDLLRTGRDARLRARLADGSQLTMGANAELEIDEFVHEPERRQAITLDVIKGALRFISGQLKGGEQRAIHIRTPVAILGVRGTELWLGPIDGATGVLVVQGEVVVGSDRDFVTLGPGEGTMIQVDGNLSPAKVWGQEKVARALAMVAMD